MPGGASSRLLPSARALALVDLAMVLWVAAWIGLGVAIGLDVHQLTRLSHTISADGHAVQQVGRNLSAAASLPLVGHAIGQSAQQVQQAGANAIASGRSSAASIRSLSILLAVAVALLPSVPVFGFYLPLRLARSREARAVRRALRDPGPDAGLKAFLAQRAIARLDYGQLRDTVRPHDAVSRHDVSRPGGESDEQTERLAAAELRRLGIDPRALQDRKSRT
ncbi:MAG: hypothetical protein ACRDL8_13095 [Solirubrobacteraceae bacterium]